MTWNSTAAAVMRNYGSEGKRFTYDGTDVSNNLHATSQFSTNMYNPIYDRDDDNGDQKWDEAEITADAPSFPPANTTFNGWVKLSRWHYHCAARICQWVWDSSSGTVAYTAQISYKPCAFCEWDKWSGDLDLEMGRRSYPSKAQSSPSGPVDEDPGPASPTAVSSVLTPSGAPYALALTEDPGEIVIRPDLSNGLEAYVLLTWELGAQALMTGPGEAVVTFSHPLTVPELADLPFVSIKTVEAVGQSGDGITTVGSAFGPHLEQDLHELADLAGAPLRGVVSAEVTVGGPAQLAAMRADARIYLVDLSKAHLQQHTPELTDVILNDLYWYVAGWLEP